MSDTAAVIETLRDALEKRRFDLFVKQFAQDGVYELPFALPTTPGRFAGIDAIRARFEAIAQSPTTQLLQVTQVSAECMQTTDPEVAVVRFTTQARNSRTEEATTMISSLAVVRCRGGQVMSYQDYPNTLGIARAAGVLQQFAASLK